MKNFANYKLVLVAFVLIFSTTYAQQDVFSRSEVSTGNFGDGQNPWYYAIDNNSQGDPDNNGTIRNFVKIGHNNNTVMITNGRFYQFNTLDFQAGATNSRTINNSGGGISASGGIYNASTALHTFNTPLGIDGPLVQIHTNSNGGLIFEQTIFINANIIQFGNVGTGEITVNGVMEGTGSVQKIGDNNLILTGTNTYTGTTSIEAGKLILQGSIVGSDITVKNGATLEIDDNLTVKSIIVEAGGYLKVNSGNSLVATNGITLKSTSAIYSNLISDGNISTPNGTITYERFVNVIGSGATGTGGNDLISLPLVPADGIQFNEFLLLGNPINATKIASLTVVDIVTQLIYAFAPYDNGLLPDYRNYTAISSDELIKGKGYRVATTSGENLTFSGEVATGNVVIQITTPIGGSQWNLVGNPFPSYLDPMKFLSINDVFLDQSAVAIYGYNSGTYTGSEPTSDNFTIINQNNLSTLNVAPGQGFFVAAENTGNFSAGMVFNDGSTFPFEDMRTAIGTDDYIVGRNSSVNYHFKLALSTTETHNTSFYFNDNSSLGLDPGYDAAAFDGMGDINKLYSHLVENNEGRNMAIQSLGENDFANVTIPLGVKANQGEQLTFSISESNLPSTTKIHLEDQVANTSTLLNSGDYTLTPNMNINGTGRFYLNVTDSSLSTLENTSNNISIYNNHNEKTVIINGQISENTSVNIIDLQGRIVQTLNLENRNTSKSIDVSSLTTGVYIIQLFNKNQRKTQKVIIQ